MIKVWEITTKLYALKDIKLNYALEQVVYLTDMALIKDERMSVFHNTNIVKPYVISNVFNVNTKDIRDIKCGSIVSFKIRTISEEIKNYFLKELPSVQNGYFKALVSHEILIPKKRIGMVKTLTPTNVTMSCKDTNKAKYWRDLNVTEEEFKVSLINNLIHKYFKITGEDFGRVDKNTIGEIVEYIEIKNKYPLYIKYKGIKLKGDSVEIRFKDNYIAQELAYFSLGCGISNKSTRGFGFANNPKEGKDA